MAAPLSATLPRAAFRGEARPQAVAGEGQVGGNQGEREQRQSHIDPGRPLREQPQEHHGEQEQRAHLQQDAALQVGGFIDHANGITLATEKRIIVTAQPGNATGNAPPVARYSC